VPDAPQRCAADGITEAESLQDADAGGEDALGAGLVAREALLLQQLHVQTGAPEQDRERRSRDATAADDHVAHSSPGMKRDL
jgi:hypothetical protein